MTKYAKGLKSYLEKRGLKVWMCSEELKAVSQYRLEIAKNAALCRAMIPLVNIRWGDSGECEYEFNIALRTSLVNKKTPLILPMIMKDAQPLFGDPLQLATKYPILMGMAGNTNCIFVSSDDPTETDFEQLIPSIQTVAGTTVDHPISSMKEAHTFDWHNPPSGHWEGYFIDYRSVEGKKAGTKWSVDAVFTFTPGESKTTFTAKNGTVEGQTWAYTISDGVLDKDGNLSCTLNYVDDVDGEWQIFRTGTLQNNQMSGRWDFEGMDYGKMNPATFWSMWPGLK